MHTLRSIGSSVAGIAIAAGVLSAPIASAVEPAEIQGDATPSTIREVNPVSYTHLTLPTSELV